MEYSNTLNDEKLSLIKTQRGMKMLRNYIGKCKNQNKLMMMKKEKEVKKEVIQMEKMEKNNKLLKSDNNIINKKYNEVKIINLIFLYY